ncbi:MAG: hypothetical protein PHI12_00210 [Dehalococcoidales bacterium]|nr:hypothetical protein [Dehalococcoidales bacterium]
MLVDEISRIASEIPAELKEKKGVFSLEFIIAERKVMFSKKKLTYSAKFRIDEGKKELRFTEMLKESGAGFSSGDSDIGPGFGFKAETYKTGGGPREGNIKEQSELFGKQYNYNYDFSKIRTAVEREADRAGYAFKYHLTSIGL